MDSTSSSTQSNICDVFISHRGNDVRYGFLSHLHRALKQKQIDPFVDFELQKGENISSALLKIIEDSPVSIVILSENYAYSSWCLDELVRIAVCRKELGQIVLPVFYRVDPAEVQYLTGSFGRAFHKLQEEFRDDKQKVDGWIQALNEISSLSGYDSTAFKSESAFVEEIANNVFEKLRVKKVIVENSINELPLLETHNSIHLDVQGEIPNMLNSIDELHLLETQNSLRIDVQGEIPNMVDTLNQRETLLQLIFLFINFGLELSLTIFDQLSSMHKPQYALISMIMSFIVILISVARFYLMGRKEKTKWMIRYHVPWFYSPFPNYKPLGSSEYFVGLVCSICQCVLATISFAFYSKGTDNPIKVSVGAIIFAFGALYSGFSKTYQFKISFTRVESDPKYRFE